MGRQKKKQSGLWFSTIFSFSIGHMTDLSEILIWPCVYPPSSYTHKHADGSIS